MDLDDRQLNNIFTKYKCQTDKNKNNSKVILDIINNKNTKLVQND